MEEEKEKVEEVVEDKEECRRRLGWRTRKR